MGEVAAVATRSELGEDEVLIVFANANAEDFDFKALFQHCVTTLPRYMVPRYYRIVDALPRTPNGKVRKVELREAGVTADTWDHVVVGLSVPR